MSAIESAIEKIESRYDAEFDLIPDGPRVTWAEFELAYALKKLLARVEELEAQVERLQSGSELEESVRIFGAG
jgi:cell division protein FtsB